MNPYWLLAPVFALCAAGAWLSYSDEARRAPGYVWQMVVLGAVCAGLFAAGAQRLDDKGKVYVFSLVYDLFVLAAYYVMPILVFGVRLSWPVVAGSILVLAGIVIIKIGG